MKNKAKMSSLLLALGLVVGVMATPISTAHAQAVVGNEAGEASIELGNTSDSTDQPEAAPEANATAANATAVNATSVNATTANAAADPAESKPPKDPREVYRDQIVKGSAETQGATSAASRRYKKVDKATYNELLKSGAIQTSQ